MGQARATGDEDQAMLANAIGEEVELANTLQKGGVDPHPICYAIAKAWRGAQLGEGDGLYAGDDSGYTVMVAKRGTHFTITRFGRAVDGGDEELAPRTVLRILRLANRLETDGERNDATSTAKAVEVLNTILAEEGLRLFALPAAARNEALQAANLPGPWEALTPRERSAAARAYATNQGARAQDLVVASWGDAVERAKLFEFVENLPA